MKNVVVEGFKYQFTSGLKGDVKITSDPSQFVKINGKGVYKGTLNVTVSNWTNGTISNGSGSGVIKADAKYMKVDGENVLLLGAKSESISITGTTQTPPYTSTTTDTFTIIDAGQSGVKAE